MNPIERAVEAMEDLLEHIPSKGRSMQDLRKEARAALAELRQYEVVEGTSGATRTRDLR